MKFKTIVLIAFFAAGLISCSENKNAGSIELPLVMKNGYGPFNSAMGGITNYSEDESNPWIKTYLKIKGAPENWTDTKFGDIDINIYQTVYQNYLLGNISKEFYDQLQKGWNWTPDTLLLSKTPLKCKIAFASGKDPDGEMKMILDANNNQDLSDDKQIKPLEIAGNKGLNKDSLALSNTIKVSYETFVDNKIVEETTSVYVAYLSELDVFMCNFPQYATTTLDGEEIAVCSNSFTNLDYKDPTIALISDSLKKGGKVANDDLISKNEYIEIKGKIYKNAGVNQKNKTLILEQTNLPKEQLLSTQVGYRSFPFEGIDFKNNSSISLDKLKGKYVLLDFWAVWCSPCKKEIPHLKDLYKKTDRSKFEIISIVGESESTVLDGLIKEHGITWPQIMANDTNKLINKYSVDGYPTTFLIDPEGIIIAKNLRGKELEDKVVSLTKK